LPELIHHACQPGGWDARSHMRTCASKRPISGSTKSVSLGACAGGTLVEVRNGKPRRPRHNRERGRDPSHRNDGELGFARASSSRILQMPRAGSRPARPTYPSLRTRPTNPAPARACYAERARPRPPRPEPQVPQRQGRRAPRRHTVHAPDATLGSTVSTFSVAGGRVLSPLRDLLKTPSIIEAEDKVSHMRAARGPQHRLLPVSPRRPRPTREPTSPDPKRSSR
jgi:hypothetical protein